MLRARSAAIDLGCVSSPLPLELTQCYQWCLTHPFSDSYLCHPLRLPVPVMELFGSYPTSFPPASRQPPGGLSSQKPSSLLGGQREVLSEKQSLFFLLGPAHTNL